MKYDAILRAKFKELGLNPTGTNSFDLVVDGCKFALPAESMGQVVQSLSQSPVALSEEELRTYLQPTDEDYVLVPTRALSATSVQNNLINFGHNNGAALQAAVSLFNSLTILKNHEFAVENWIGKTQDSYWDNQTPNVPPGVNLLMKLDCKADPKTVRGVVSGVLDSVSVTVSFEWEQSHPNMKESEFWQKLGEKVDGKLVQLCVTKITRLYELSVVWQGADQFAKTVDSEGNIHTPGVASNSLSLEDPTVNLKALIVKFGLQLDPNTATAEQVQAALEEKLTAALSSSETSTAALTEAQTKITALEADLTTTKAQLSDVTAQLDTMKANAQLGVDYLAKQRSEALRLYNLVEANKATEAMRTLLGNAALEVCQSFIDSYTPRAEAIAPLACTSCGCTSLSRRHTQQSHSEDGTQHQDATLEVKRMESVLASMH